MAAEYKYYSGMCVGGPMDGKGLTHETPYYQVYIRPEFKWPISADVAATSPLTYETYRYKHVIGLRGTFEIDFWANPEEFKDVSAIFYHMFGEYGRMKRKELEQ